MSPPNPSKGPRPGSRPPETEKRPSDRRTDIQEKTQDEITALREKAPHLRKFTEKEVEEFNRITGQKYADSRELVAKLRTIFPRELEEWGKKAPDFISRFFNEKESLAKTEKEFHEKGMFVTHGNKDIEWSIGLRHLIKDKRVQSVVLYTAVENLGKAGKKNLLNNSNVQKVERDGKKYIVRKSTERDDEGNFYDQFGYLAIFEGDRYEIRKEDMWTDAQLKEYEEKQLAQKKAARTKIAAELRISTKGLTEDQVDQKIQEEYGKRTVELLRNGPEWSKLINEAMQRFGLPTNPFVMSVLGSMMKYESGMRPDAENASSKAFGLGQFLTGTRRSQYKQMRAKGIEGLPDDGPDGIFKYDPKWQLYCLAQFVKSNADLLEGKGINVFSGKARDIAFLYLAHHDGPGGVNMFIKWWKANGRPDEIPKFPHDESVNQQYAVAGFQSRRGIKGTNGILNYAYKVANTALTYQEKSERLLTDIQTAETKFERRMTA